MCASGRVVGTALVLAFASSAALPAWAQDGGAAGSGRLDCAITWSSEAPVAIAQNPCPEGDLFADHGLPAISRDGRRVAVADTRRFAARESINLRVLIFDVKTGRLARTLLVAAPEEEINPVELDAPLRARLKSRLATANRALRDFIPMDHAACTPPAPWPTEDMGSDVPCGAAEAPEQHLTCKLGDQSLAVSVERKRLRVTRGKALVLDRDVSNWTYRYDPFWGSGKKTAEVRPYVQAASIDPQRGVLLLQSEYCNLTDSTPDVPTRWTVLRVP